ncbi:unnamed protein product [Ectocarpus sp. 12 AP-2014]
MRDVGIINETDEDSDHTSYQRTGGCVWTTGTFTVNGDATLTGCESVGAGGRAPGPGGAVFVGETGSVSLSEGAMTMETSITDDFGGQGGGIYNLGEVNVAGGSRSEDILASSGVAIDNGEGAQFRFTNGATAYLRDLSNRGSVGSALYNLGYFEFSEPALFV